MSTPSAAATPPGVVLAVVGLKREARLLAGPGVRTVIGGGDADGLRTRLRHALADQSVIGVISVGLSGALHPKVRVGDWVIGTSVVANGDVWRTDQIWRAAIQARLTQAGLASDVHLGPIAGSRVMVADGEAKAALHSATGALAVDMESDIAAEAAQVNGLAFAALRVISDGADRALPKAAQAGMKPDGGLDLKAVIRALIRDPRQLPALIRTGREAEVAFRALALLGRHDLPGRPRVGELDLGELGLDVT